MKWIPSLIVPAGFLVSVAVGCTRAPAPTAGSNIRQSQPSLAAVDVVIQAQAVVNSLQDRRANGEALTATFVDSYLNWSRRLAEAECDAVATRADRIAAIKQHISRIQASVPLLYEGKVPHPQADIMNYYNADAKRWLERVERE